MTSFKTDLAIMQPSVKETLRQNGSETSSGVQATVQKNNEGEARNQRWLKISRQNEVMQGIIWAEIIGPPKSCRRQRFRTNQECSMDGK